MTRRSRPADRENPHCRRPRSVRADAVWDAGELQHVVAPRAVSTVSSDVHCRAACTADPSAGRHLVEHAGAAQITSLKRAGAPADRKSRFQRRAARSEEHTSELQSLMRISYAVFCLTKKHTLIHNLSYIIRT